MFGAALQGLGGIVVGLGMIGFTIHGAIGFFAQRPVPLAAAAYLVVTVLFVLFGGFIAYHNLKVPIVLWRGRRMPLPAIDGTPIVIARKPPRRLWRMLGIGIALGLLAVVLLKKWPQMPDAPLLFYFPLGLFLLGFVVALVRTWFPPRLYWESIVLDSEGIEDRSLGKGKIPWRNVRDVSLGALAAGNGTLLKLAEPPKRLAGVTALDTGFLPLLDRMTQGRRHLLIRTHGLDLHHERLYRLIHAYWRWGSPDSRGVITRSSR
jgi:hypothetical protein